MADADDIHARLTTTGLPFFDFADTPTGLRQLFVRDPDGNMIELIGPTKQPRAMRALLKPMILPRRRGEEHHNKR